jgi:hypothetical protein
VIYLPAHRTVFVLFSPQQNMQSPISEARSLGGQFFHLGSQRSIVPLPPLIPHAASRNAY